MARKSHGEGVFMVDTMIFAVLFAVVADVFFCGLFIKFQLNLKRKVTFGN